MLRQYQIDHLAAITAAATAHKRVLVQAPTGCHAFGHEILMADGSVKQVQEITVGDRVMGPDSMPREVIFLHRGEGEMFEITPKRKSSPFSVNLDHIFSFYVTKQGSVEREQARSESSSLRDYLAGNKWYRHLRKIRQVGVEFQRRDLPMNPWFLGYLIGDGSLSRTTISLCDESGGPFDAARNYAVLLGDSVRGEVGKNGKANTQHFRGGNVKAVLTNLGLAGKRAGEKFIPREFLISARYQRLSLLAGLLDSDGHYGWDREYDWISKSEQLAQDFSFLVRSLGLSCVVRVCWKSCQSFSVPRKYWRVTVSGDLSVLNGHSRKIFSHSARRQIKRCDVSGFTVRPVGVGRYYGFELSGDRLYLDAEFRVHHNSGKSILFADLIRRAHKKGKLTLFLVHRRELLFQAEKHLNKHGLSCGYIMAGETYTPGVDVQLGSIPTVHRRLSRLDFSRYSLVIVDEAHRVGARTHQEIIKQCNGAHIIGFTATPIRKGGEPLGSTFDTLIRGPKVQWLTDNGYLAGVEYMAPTPIDMRGVKTVAGEYSPKDVHEKAVPKAIGGVVDHYLKYGGKKGIIFACNKKHSQYLQEDFARHGKRALVIDSDSTESERFELLREFIGSESGILINCQIFGEGFDAPECDTIVMAMPTRSLGRYLQCIGRGMRPKPDGGRLLVIDHFGNIYRHGLVEEDREWSLERSETDAEIRGRQGVLVKKYAACRTCGTLLTAKTCPVCGQELTAFHRAQNIRELKHCGLVLYDKKTKVKAKEDRKASAATWNNLVRYAALKNRSLGWLVYLYKDRYGKLPWNDSALRGARLPRGGEWKLKANEWLEQSRSDHKDHDDRYWNSLLP